MNIDGAKFEGGWWFPATEEHMLDMMRPGAKMHKVVKNRWTYQYHKLQMCLTHIPYERRRVCLDVGAFIGQWTYHLIDYFAHVHCFEPIELHRACWAENMRGAANVEMHKEALGERCDTVRFHIPQKTCGGTHVATPVPKSGDDGPIAETDEVYMTYLDQFNLVAVDFIKIDVEGYELMVLKGGQETLDRCRPYILVEQKGNDERYYGQKSGSALEFLTRMGMRVLACKSGDYLLGW